MKKFSQHLRELFNIIIGLFLSPENTVITLQFSAVLHDRKPSDRRSRRRQGSHTFNRQKSPVPGFRIANPKGREICFGKIMDCSGKVLPLLYTMMYNLKQVGYAGNQFVGVKEQHEEVSRFGSE